ncbi:MAG: phosphoribosylglycinamide formyltransferase [Deltaproteobacteria bacterium]|jgi:phosphoribosylglycinamide formyltransferase-1|nr:phosphoribosylglycinamide formyltransferase [Deltaproteobacteria bacterium]
MKFAVFCSGRGSNLASLLKAYENGQLGGAEPVAVICDSHYAGALNVARERGVYSTFVPRTAYHANREGYEKRLLEVLAPFEVEFVVLAGFLRILGPLFLAAFPERVINIHPALLPSFPGHGVWAAQVESGVKLAGATVHFVDQGVDTGPIIIQAAVPVLDADDPDELASRILSLEHKILPQAVRWMAQGRLEISGRKVTLKDQSAPNGLDSLVWPPLEPELGKVLKFS